MLKANILLLLPYALTAKLVIMLLGVVTPCVLRVQLVTLQQLLVPGDAINALLVHMQGTIPLVPNVLQVDILFKVVKIV